MTQETKHREFWIDPCRHPDSELSFYFGEALLKHPRQGPLSWQANLIHVIEYAAFEEIDELYYKQSRLANEYHDKLAEAQSRIAIMESRASQFEYTLRATIEARDKAQERIKELEERLKKYELE